MTLPEPKLAEMPTSGPLVDKFGRAHDYLRVSVTDRCNYRCVYCMPAEGLAVMPRRDLLNYEEITRIVHSFASMGIRRVRLTGGEPTVRRDIVHLVQALASIDGVEEVTMTTNGHLFTKYAVALANAGLTRVNVSLDTLDPKQFKELTRGGDVARVLTAIDACIEAGLTPVKINAVVVRGVNDHQVVDLVEHFMPQAGRVVVRFIEYMPFSSIERRQRHVPADEVRKGIAERHELVAVERRNGGGPATSWRLAESGLDLGFISPITEHFCHDCNRLRLMADGDLRTCLSKDDTPSLRDLMRDGCSDRRLERTIREMVWGKIPGHEAHLGGHFEGVMTRVGG
jgi:GTP 3',8-cyclase